MKKFIFVSLVALFSAAAFAYAAAPAPAPRFAAQPVAEIYPQCVFVPEGTNNTANAPCFADLTAVAYDNTGNVAGRRAHARLHHAPDADADANAHPHGDSYADANADTDSDANPDADAMQQPRREKTKKLLIVEEQRPELHSSAAPLTNRVRSNARSLRGAHEMSRIAFPVEGRG